MEELKRYLSINPLICTFPLDTPIEQDLPTETAEALQALQTYSGQTNISAIVDGLMPDLTVEYVQDIQKVITDLQAEIAALKNNTTP